MTAYIAISYSKRKALQPVLDTIKKTLNANNISPFVFIEQYNFSPAEEEKMMQMAFAEIDKCSLLIAEVSDKAIGIGIEVGYAKAKNKTVIYLRAADAEHSTTVAGASDYSIIYSNTGNLQLQLDTLLKQIALSSPPKNG